MLLIMCIVLIAQTSQTDEMCPSDFDYINGVEWSASIDKSLSKPMCLNKNNEFQYRECSSGQWKPPPICYSLQQTTLPQCPYGFTDAGNLCYQLSRKSIFPPRCPYKNVAPFYLYKDLVSNRAIWVPARRDGLAFLQWTDASWLYRQEVNNYNFTKPLNEKECLVYSKQTYTAVSCKSQYVGICAYKKLDQIDYNLCGSEFKCRQSDFEVSSKCFCQDSRSLDFEAAEFVKPYQYNIYKKLTNDTCTIGLMKDSSGKYVWRNSQAIIDYVFWSTAVHFSNRTIYGAGTPEGWILTEDPLPCVIFQTDIVDLEPSLSLQFDQENHRFLLTVTNPQALKKLTRTRLFCYTNADSLNLIYTYTGFEMIRYSGESMVYAFDPLENASGDYWCEAFKHINSEVIKTDVYFLRPTDYLEFVGIFQVSYDSETNPLSSDVITILQNRLFTKINVSSVQAVRVMDITDLEEEPQLVSINVHFTSTERIGSDDAENQYLILQTFLEDILKDNDDIRMVGFRSSDFCSSENGSLTWQTAPIGSSVSPAEFCFSVNATPVTRSCDGDFMSGGQWSPLEYCQLFEASPITERLLDISHNNSVKSVDEIYQISLDYPQFTSLDVYIVGSIYSTLRSIRNISVLGETISNLLRINSSELMEAQSKLGATDKFLYLLDRINFEYNWTFDLNFQNVYFVSLRSKDLSGLGVVRDGNKLVVTKLTGNYSLENITQIDHLISAIWLSPQFRNELSNYEKVTFSLYFSQGFFPQTTNMSIGIIFGMMRPSSADYFYGPAYVVHRSTHHQQDSYCSFWGYSLTTRGSWKRFRRATSSPPFLMCDYWHFANYAIITPASGGSGDHPQDDSGVTNELINLLESNDSVPETMQKLSEISEEFCHFAPVDLSFVGQILERVSDNEDVDFSYLAKTVSNIQQVSKDVLSQSQTDEKSTDKILLLIDHIVKRHSFKNTVTITSDHFMIFLIDPKENVTGVALFGRDSLEPLLLYSNDSIDDVGEYEDFDSAVMLSPELHQQILPDMKIIIAVYLNDALFNEESPRHAFVSKIFDVTLPELGDFEGPVSIYFKNGAAPESGEDSSGEIGQNVSQRKQCVFWYYDPHISGSWKEDRNITNYSSLVRCDFWHTTHFAYLILDEDRFDDAFDHLFDVLGLLTSINCAISLLSLVFIVLTAVLFKQWRENTGNQILLNFSLVIIIQIVVFYGSNRINQKDSYILCTVVGILLHYAIVSQFCWMFVIAILQFRRFVTVLEGPPSYVLLKACVCGWILPLLPVSCVFGIDRDNYVKSNVGLCYPSGLGLYLGVWLPICIIILINLVIFSITLYSVIHKKTEYVNGSNEALYQWRLAVLLFFILGFTWCFAFLAELDFGIVFEYLFCMTATLQGFTLFLFFIVLNANTRGLYVSAVAKYCKRKFG